jgi:putative phage-type endonuclease
MYKLISKLEHIIHSNFSYDFNKIENIIKSNDVFIELDIMEQELIIEEAIEKHSEISEKKKNTDDINPSYKDVKVFMKKSGYKFGSHNEEPEKIKLDDGRELTEGEIMSDRVKAVIINPPTQEDWERRAKIFEDTKIKSANMPLQKSAGWHELRRGRVGGSECGTLLNMNKHQAQYTFILDKVLGAEFKGNAATYHGNIFEDPIRMMYEYNNDVHAEEFSSLPHATNSILAASPDGIVSPYCRDMKTPTQLVGRMLEIKAPTMRKIKYSGDIKDTICPVYYWCQVQQQLECLDLDECDFIQCNIERYGGREEWLADTHPECDFRSLKYGNLRGVVIELIPTKLSECDYNEKGYLADMTIWTKTKCLFPPKIDMSLKELDDWILGELSKLPWGYSLHNIIYWRLIEQNCTLILRNREWFKSQLPTYNKIWGYVEYLRANLDVCEKWKEWIDVQPRKYNDKVMAKLDMLIQEKENSINGINEPMEIIQETKKSIKSTKSSKKQDGELDNKQGITINLDSDDETQTQTKIIIKTKKSKKTEPNELEQVEIDTQIEMVEQIEETEKIEQVEVIEKVKRKYVRKPKQN